MGRYLQCISMRGQLNAVKEEFDDDIQQTLEACDKFKPVMPVFDDQQVCMPAVPMAFEHVRVSHAPKHR